ncbi:metal-dependent transcriptional regulator [Arcanobacterium hippocoleae]
MSELIDTTEMYLKTVFELEEEGVPALRARIVERLGQSGPTVSETVARLERDGLLVMPDGRHIEFTAQGRMRAVDVMRRHRISECFLMDVLKMPLAKIHAEACRWEHAISDEVAARMAETVGSPATDPFGNPIPVQASSERESASVEELGLISLAEVKIPVGGIETVRVVRFAEMLQLDEEQIALFDAAGLLPGAEVIVREISGDDVFVDVGTEKLAVPTAVAARIFVK